MNINRQRNFVSTNSSNWCSFSRNFVYKSVDTKGLEFWPQNVGGLNFEFGTGSWKQEHLILVQEREKVEFLILS